MAYALVQAQTTQATPNPALNAGATAGNLIIVAARTSTGGTVALSDGSYTRATASGLVAIFYKVAAGGETSVTVTGGSLPGGFMAEFSGNAASSPVDQVASIATGATSPLSLTNAAADAAAGSLVVGIEFWQLSKAATQTSGWTFNNGATAARFNIGESDDASSVSNHTSAWYGITTGKASADTGSATSDSMNITTGSAVMASFQIFTAAAPLVLLPHPAFIYLRKNT